MSNVIKAETVSAYTVEISEWVPKEGQWYTTKKTIIARDGREAEAMVIRYFISQKILGVVKSFPMQITL